MNLFLFVCCILSLCVGSLGFRGFVSPGRSRPATTSSLHMSSSSSSLLGGRFDTVTTQMNALSDKSVSVNTFPSDPRVFSGNIFGSDPSSMGIQDLLHQAVVNHEIAVTCTVTIMVGLGYMIIQQLLESDGKIGIGEYWFTFLLLGDLAYSIKG